MRYIMIILTFTISISFEIYSQQYHDWNHSKNLILNTSSTGANHPDNIDNLLIKIELNQDNFSFNQTKNSGDDIRFTTSQGTSIPFFIESYNKSAQTAELWLRVNVMGNDETQYIKLYWGKSDALAADHGPSLMQNNSDIIGVYVSDTNFKIINKINPGSSDISINERWLK